VPYVDNETCNAPGSYGGKIIPTIMCAGVAAISDYRGALSIDPTYAFAMNALKRLGASP